jgi:hypothetical protein
MVTKAAGWTEDDATRLREFLRSDTGRRVGLMMRDLITRSAISAMDSRGEKLPQEAGRVVGLRDFAAWLDALASETRRAPVDPTDDRPNANLHWLHGHDDDNDRTA